MKNLSSAKGKDFKLFISSFKTTLFCVIIFLLLFFTVLNVKSANLPLVFINEIAWMGTENSFSDEWIELYNNSEEKVSLTGWVLQAADKSPEIYLRGVISPKGFYLLERSDDNTVPNIVADQIYIGSLENKGEALSLYDNFGNLIDFVDCESDWFAGDNKTKQTMERSDQQQGWQNSRNSGGTPKAKNSKGVSKNEGGSSYSNETTILKEDLKGNFLAKAGLTINTKYFLFIFLIAFIFSLFSAILILILKKKIKNN